MFIFHSSNVAPVAKPLSHQYVEVESTKPQQHHPAEVQQSSLQQQQPIVAAQPGKYFNFYFKFNYLFVTPKVDMFLFLFFPALNTIDLSQVSVPAKPLTSLASPVVTIEPVSPLSNPLVKGPTSSSSANPAPIASSNPVDPGSMTSQMMSQVADPPKLTVRFPSFVTQDKLIQNSIDR